MIKEKTNIKTVNNELWALHNHNQKHYNKPKRKRKPSLKIRIVSNLFAFIVTGSIIVYVLICLSKI